MAWDQISRTSPLGKTLVNSMSSHLVEGCEITIDVDPTKVSIAEGTLAFVNSYDNRNNPTFDYKHVNSISGLTPDFVATGDDATVFSYEPDLSLTQVGSFQPTRTDFRERVYIGAAVHFAGINIDIDNSIRVNGYNLAASIADLSDMIGLVNYTGNQFTANGTNLNVDQSDGCLGKIASNIKESLLDPNNTDLTGNTAGFFFARFRDGSGGWKDGEFTDTLRPGSYDDGTGGGVFPNGVASENKWQIRRFYLFPNNLYGIIYGQNLYNSSDEAIENINTEDYESDPVLEASIFRGYLLNRGGATDLSDTGDAIFIDVDRFGLGLRMS